MLQGRFGRGVLKPLTKQNWMQEVIKCRLMSGNAFLNIFNYLHEMSHNLRSCLIEPKCSGPDVSELTGIYCIYIYIYMMW
jgi:hypothetical protein